ncbi:MAG: DUF456 domain-containing protein [Candidatus Pacebacteria bacterium]|nr:DUF456 domain-containing protein [Candidatus Paceibacterota bacterium]
MLEILYIIFSFVLVAAAAVGVILPFLPGVPLAWAGMLLFAYTTGFTAISFKAVLIFLGLTVLITILDIVAPILGAKRYKASKYGLLGSFAGTIIGVFMLGPLGIIVGPLLGALMGEYFGGREMGDAWKSAKGAAIGMLIGNVIKLALIMIMAGFMIAAIF